MDNSYSWQLGETLDEAERKIIESCLGIMKGDIKATANSLGRSHRTIENKLEQYRAEQESFKEAEIERDRKRVDFLQRSRATPAQFMGTTFPANPPIYDDYGNLLNPHDFESPPQTSAQQSVSVPKQKEIQAVLPEQVTTFGKKRTR